MRVNLVIYVIIVVCCCYSCTSPKSLRKQSSDMYHIEAIVSKNSWYIIYAEKQDTLYKIVSARQENEGSRCRKIRQGGFYSFELVSHGSNIPVINGIKLAPVNYLDVKKNVKSRDGKDCYAYDQETEICTEPERGIYDLYYTSSLRGVCYIEQ